MLGTGHAEWSNQREVRELREPRLAAMRRMSRPPKTRWGVVAVSATTANFFWRQKDSGLRLYVGERSRS